MAALREGGNAADAAVAAAAVCAVVMPHRTSIGGDMFALAYDTRSRDVTVYNGSGAAPHRLDTDAFGPAFPASGASIATVPGLIAGLADLVADHGRLGLDRALAPAIGYAENGFPVSDVLAEAIGEEGERLAHDDEATQLFGPRGRWARAGEMLQQPDLAASLRAVAHAGDPARVDFDARRLLDAEFVATRRRAVSAKASERSEAGSLMTPADTTYLAVVDRDGNAVSLIESVFSAFGAATVVPGTGILLNNRLSGFSLDPSSPNAIAPGKRPVHTLNTVIALEGSMPRFVFGTPGRHAQVQTNFQLAVGLIDFGMDVQQAIEEPRWFHESGRTLKMERRYPEAVRRAVAAKGHEVAVLGDWAEITGGAQAIAIEPNGSFAGGADPRREGQAAGY